VERKRIQVYADTETKRRIELAAAKHDLPVTEYCIEAIRQQLAEEGILEEERIEIQISPAKRKSLVRDLRALQEKIKTRRSGKLIDLDRILEGVREERDYELDNLH